MMLPVESDSYPMNIKPIPTSRIVLRISIAVPQRNAAAILVTTNEIREIVGQNSLWSHDRPMVDGRNLLLCIIIYSLCNYAE